MPVILVVDDSAVDRTLVAGLCEKQPGWEVVTVANGADALFQFCIRTIDVVVTDLVMPHMNGLQLLEAICDEHAQIPVIVMTSQGNEQIAVRCLELGAASYVSKKRMGDDLIPTVRQVLARTLEERSFDDVMKRMKRNRTIFSFRNDLDLIRAAVRFLQGKLRCLGLCPGREVQNVGIALEEALLNAYYHGNLEANSTPLERGRTEYMAIAESRARDATYSSRRIRVESTFQSAAAIFCIRDDGSGFDASLLPEDEDETLERPQGRGTRLMRQFMDDVRYNAAGNEVTLVKNKSAWTLDSDQHAR